MSLSTRLDKLEAAIRGGHDRLMDLGLWIAYLDWAEGCPVTFEG